MISHSPAVTLALAGQIVAARLRRTLGGFGLKPAQSHVLTLLAEQGATGQQALVEALRVDPSVLVTMLNELERAGLAERRRDPADRRRHIVEISARGTELVGKIQASVAVVEAEMFADLSMDEIAQLQALVERIKPADDSPCDGETD